MTAPNSLLELLLNLLRDPSALAAYQDDPDGYLSSCGDISPEDVRDALVLLQDDSQDADFSREHNSGGNHIHVPPPPAPEPHDGDDDHEAAVRYLNTYITNNNIDDRDTNIDNSVNQQINTEGGNFDQDIDIDSTVASGDGAVAAGDDIDDSDIVTGDDNTVGDDNVKGDDNVTGDDNESVHGDDNTTSFGDGDSTSSDLDGDVDVDDGSSFAAGGSSTVDNTDNSVEDSHDDNSDNSVEDSGNDTHTATDDSEYSVDDSFNDDSESTETTRTDVDHSSVDAAM